MIETATPDPGDSLQPQYEAALRQMPAGVILAEVPSGRWLLVSERVEEIWRRRLEPVERLEVDDREGYGPDGHRYDAADWPLARAVRRQERIDGEEIEIVRGDGSRGILEVSAVPVRDPAGRIVCAVEKSLDVTGQRRRERLRRFLSEASALLASSLDYEVTLRNVARLAVPSLADWCAVDLLRDDGTIERLAAEHVDERKARAAQEIARRYPVDPKAAVGVARVLRTGEPELHRAVDTGLLEQVADDPAHLRLLRASGIRSAIIVPLTARDRRLGAMLFVSTRPDRLYDDEDLAFAQDLGVRAAAAIDNARLYRQSQEANRAKADFLAIVSHELRTPLTAVIGYSELLAMGVPDALTTRQQEQVERIEVSARHLLQLIEEILTMASLETGTLRIRPDRVTLDEVLRKAEVIARPLAEAKGLTLRVPRAGIDIVTDPERLLQVLLNLLSNAVKFTPAGGVELETSVRGGRVRLTVRDTGIGLSDEHRSRIFDPFWQAEQPITRTVGGTGLGLSIARRLAEALGGAVSVESTPGEGTTFMIDLPLRPRGSAGNARAAAHLPDRG